MWRRWLCVSVVVMCLPVFSGCALSRSVRENREVSQQLRKDIIDYSDKLSQSVRENREISRRIRKDIIDYYENMAQAYWVLGLDYYRLSQLAKERDDPEVVTLYQNNAVMYRRYSDDLRRTVEIWRKEYGLGEAPEKVPIEPADLPTSDWSDLGFPPEEVKPDAVKPVEVPPEMERPVDPLRSLDTIPATPAVSVDETSTGPESAEFVVPAEPESGRSSWIDRLKFWRKNK